MSGRWPFNSGCPHADWLQVGVLVTDSGVPRMLPGGAPDWRFAFVPAPSAAIEDTWHAMGLRGTGSHHLTLADVHVPPEQIAAPFFEHARHDGPLWKIPLITLAATFLAAVPLGIARRAIDEFTAAAVRKVRGPAAHSVGHDAEAQCQMARAEGALASARSLLFDTIASVWDTARQGNEPVSTSGPSSSWRRTRPCGRLPRPSTGCFAWPTPKRSSPSIPCSAVSGTSTPWASTSCSAAAETRHSPRSA